MTTPAPIVSATDRRQVRRIVRGEAVITAVMGASLGVAIGVRRLVMRTVQTNEPGRSVALYGALLWLAEQHRLPGRLLEIGASAGLNLQVDRYRYLVRGRPLGDPESPLSFAEPWDGGPVRDPWSVQGTLAIAERRGCDCAPLDVTTVEGATTVLSYIWPDEPERLVQVKKAIELARRRPICVEAAAAARWTKERLAERHTDGLTVVWQSVVYQYLGDAERRDLDLSMEEAGAEASQQHPLAWVTLEPTGDHLSGFELSCRAWPPDATVVLASSGDHGPPVRWYAGASSSDKSSRTIGCPSYSTGATIVPMAVRITQRELRNESGEIMRALDGGESFVVTRNGVAVGELVPLRRRRFVAADAVLAAFKGAPQIDAPRMRAEIDAVLDQASEPRA
ncbi:MAG: DUF2332 family protein [Solirubrobacteraceae bacterium MAG38_C4-C5]|nr:DUF2332 family protein [Candidatus Siliceabacter maunaloa]